MSRKSKYSPELVKTICDAIAQTGSDRAGYEAGGISAETFYQWLKKNPEFSEGISRAKTEYQDICPGSLVRQANKAFADVLYGRVEVSVATLKRKQNKDGTTESTEMVRKFRPSVPRWAIERVLGKPLDVLEAIKTLAQAGILPHNLVQVAADEVRAARDRIGASFSGALPEGDVRTTKPGLSEETAAAIRAHILGLEDAQVLATREDTHRISEPGEGSQPQLS